MDRETKKITLPISQLEVEVYTYIKAREVVALRKQEDGQKYMVETLVVSLSGSKEDVYNKVMDLRWEDYKAIDEALTGLIQPVEKKI